MTSVISRLPLSRGFTPFVQHQTRPFETLERGTWFIPTTTWPPQTRTDFWDHMKITVGEGRLGWGIFVRREMVQIRDGMEVFGGKLAERTDEVVKVSCWGEVAREVWVFLWIFSSRAVKGVGARWIDASGEAVVVMK